MDDHTILFCAMKGQFSLDDLTAAFDGHPRAWLTPSQYEVLQSLLSGDLEAGTLSRLSTEAQDHLHQMNSNVRFSDIIVTQDNLRQWAREVVNRRMVGEFRRIQKEYAPRIQSGDPSAIADFADALANLPRTIVGNRQGGSAADLVDKAQAYLDRRIGLVDGGFVLTPFDEFNMAQGGFPIGGLTLVAGQPGCMKTALIQRVTQDIALTGDSVAWYTEMPVETMMFRDAIILSKAMSITDINHRSAYIGKLSNDLRRLEQAVKNGKGSPDILNAIPKARMLLETEREKLRNDPGYIQLREVVDSLKQFPIFYTPIRGGATDKGGRPISMSARDIRNNVDTIAQKQGQAPAMVVVDHVALIRTEGNTGDDDSPLRYTKTYNEMQAEFAADFPGTALVILQHLNRGIGDQTGYVHPVSGHLMGRSDAPADCAIVLVREEQHYAQLGREERERIDNLKVSRNPADQEQYWAWKNGARLCVVKGRNGELGEYKLRTDGKYLRWDNLP